MTLLAEIHRVVVYTPAEDLFYNSDFGANMVVYAILAILSLGMAYFLSEWISNVFTGKFRGASFADAMRRYRVRQNAVRTISFFVTAAGIFFALHRLLF